MKVAGYLLVVLLVALSLAGESNAWRWFRNTFRKKYPITATGRIQCYIDGSYKPMPQILVKLMDKELIGNKFIASTWADENGRFTVSGEGRDLIGKPDPRIRVDYEFLGVPSYGGKIKVQDRLRWIRRYRSTVRSYASNINFGDINISDEHCRAYMRFYAAVKSYISRTGTSLPYSTLHVSTNAVFASWFNTVYATLDRIRIGRGEDLTTKTAQHEVAHTVRHSYDGNIGHFLVDVGRYNYAQHHHCGKQTNCGFAFNEGWAEFWAGECIKTNLCHWTPKLSLSERQRGVDPCVYKYRIEGNVANALRKLQSTCGTSDANMVAVLKRSRHNSIHSFDEYNAKHREYYNCGL